jgi:hypothetical protein
MFEWWREALVETNRGLADRSKTPFHPNTSAR